MQRTLKRTLCRMFGHRVTADVLYGWLVYNMRCTRCGAALANLKS